MKTCTRCGIEQDEESFNRDRSRQDGRYPQCSTCTKELKKASRLRKPPTKEQRREYARRWRAKNPETHRAAERRRNLRRMGITAEDYDSRLAGQNGGCAICHTAPTTKLLAIDHNHETGVIRGLLCSNCNTGLGLFKDNPTLLQAALTYLS